jgi:hypothetical protein
MALHKTRRFFEEWFGHRSDHNPDRSYPDQAVLKAQSQFIPKRFAATLRCLELLIRVTRPSRDTMRQRFWNL